MIQEAIKMGINLHLTLTDVDAMLRRKDLELKRINGKHSKARNFYLAYISEGMGMSQDWGMVMTHQKKNGSLFNSPSTTSVAFSHLQDSHCHSYLCSVLQQFGNAVPTIYPLDAYSRLYMVDTLENLGIDRFFKENIRCVLNETCRHWEEGNEEIFSDPVTCMMALRLLRGHGYDISLESLVMYHEEDFCFDRFGGHLEDIRAALELFRASQSIIYPHESYLENSSSRARHFLKQKISNRPMQVDKFRKRVIEEVADTLKNPYHACLERLANRKHIENYNFDDTRAFKTSTRCTNFCNEVLLQLATEDFSYCQSIHLQEFKELQRWLTESKLDQLTFSRQKLGYCYFSAAATLFSPELAAARTSWAKNGVLTTVVDDFFDVGSSKEEQLNLIELVEKWDANGSVQSCSEKVHIIFAALQATVCEIGKKAYAWQDRDVTGHIVEIWLSLIKSMMKEAEMLRNNSLPTMGEYMENGYVSFALGPIVLPALYFVGPKLSEVVIRSTEYQNLFKHMSTCGRLLNDVQGFQREAKEGKLNAVSLHLLHGGGEINKEDAIRELRWIIDDKRRELLRMVLHGNDSLLRRDCRDLFWKMSKVLHFFYFKDDGFTSQDMGTAVKAVLYDPIEIRSTDK